MEKKIVTIALVFDDKKVLLAMKKRGYGAGRWNGYGGKLNPGESVDDAMKREVKEESGLEVIKYQKIGIINYTSDIEEKPSETHIYQILEYIGEPEETEEMSPRWFELTDIPYNEMWPGDIDWLPILFKGKKIRGNYHFIDNDTISTRELVEVDYL